MEKTITALFDTTEEIEAARSAARANGAEADKISVCRAIEPASFGGKNTVTGLAVGAAAGTALGMGATLLENMGMISAIGPVAGLISGAVVGAIVGGFMDYEASQESPEERWLFTVSMDENRTGSTARQLRRCGGEKVCVD
ncbi:MAG: hypothetical protein ACI4SS_07095 [Clostridia bacterium]